MIWFRLLIGIFVFLLMAYYATVVLQLLGFPFLPDEEITLKGIIPFYYWKKLFSTKKTTSKKSKK